jgi:hypothetical protein
MGHSNLAPWRSALHTVQEADRARQRPLTARCGLYDLSIVQCCGWCGVGEKGLGLRCVIGVDAHVLIR